MGQRVTQRILICDLCGQVPGDGEHMWEMGRDVWCAECYEKQENEFEEESE